jgi:hypothetical protein
LEQRKQKEERERIPPEIQYRPVMDCVLRYVKTNASASNVQVNGLMGLFIMAHTSTTGSAFYSAIKIKSFKAYLSPTFNTAGTGVAPNSISISSRASMVSGCASQKSVSDVATSARGAYVKFRIGKQNAFWLDTAAANEEQSMVTITGPIGTIVDLHCVLGLNNLNTSQPIFTSTGATAGRQYANYLDSSTTQYLQSTAPNLNSLVWVAP